MKKIMITLLVWFLMAVPAHADIIPEKVYAEHLEMISFYTESDIDTVAQEVIDTCEKNQEILAWWYEWEQAGSGTTWTVRYEWRPTTKLLYGFGVVSNSDLIMQQKADDILHDIIRPEMSDYQKIYEIYHWIQDNTDYDYETYYRIINDTNIDRRDASQSAGSVFFDGRAVCAGYADAFYYLANLAGVDCIWVHGGDHGWNAVKLNGSWYFIDVTDESGRGFLRGTAWAAANGYDWSECWLPVDVSEKDYAF